MSNAETVEQEPEITEETIEGAGEALLKQCSRVRVRISWFSTSAKIDRETAAEMVAVTEADQNMVSLSKKFMNCKHDALSQAKQAKKAIIDYVQSMTVPMLAIRAASDAEAGLAKDAGIRLIQKKDMAYFDERIQFLIGILNTAVENLQKALPAIKTEEKARLKKLYSEQDYPKDVTKLVGVTVSYEPVGVDIDWKELCPAIYEREAASAREKFALVVENAAEEFAGTFTGYVQQICEQLGNRRRINPTKDSGYTQFNDAEILDQIEHAADPETVPKGHILLRVRVKKAGKGRSEDIWLDEPITLKFLHDKLRPYETDEKKKLYASTVDNLKGQLERFLNVGDMLGPYKDVIDKSVEQVKQMLVDVSKDMNSEDIAEELRKSEFYRKKMTESLLSVKQAIEDSVESAKPMRRKVVRSQTD